MALTTRSVAYPPRGRLLVPAAAGRRPAAAGAAIFMACRPGLVAAHHVGWALLRTAGPWAYPGRRVDGALDDGEWTLLDAVGAAVGGVDALAMLRRRQESRDARLWLALRDGRAVAFVKAVSDAAAAGLERERRALDALCASDGPVTVPRVIAHGVDAPWSWVASEAMVPRPHRPAVHDVPLDAIVAWLHDALGDVVGPRPADLAAHWLPMHGDFTPWNLRRYLGGALVLLDFEEVGFGPPAADLMYWHAARAALRGRARTAFVDDESRAFWLSRVEARLARGVDPRTDARLVRALRGPA